MWNRMFDSSKLNHGNRFFKKAPSICEMPAFMLTRQEIFFSGWLRKRAEANTTATYWEGVQSPYRHVSLANISV